ncbi:hypothetical protein FACS189483_02620 [Spirochaetia bacterium]|nr:hypothetical protein FACS189483_02620 [Spirochaetia bacterium]
MQRIEYTEPGEVAAQVAAFVYLVGSMNFECGPDEEINLGLSCIGRMVEQNVKAMITDFYDQLGINGHGIGEEKEPVGVSGET